jgi:GTP cyclohydrolase II
MADKRFEEIYTQGKLKVTKMIRDNETGVLYMLHQEGYGTGLTVLLDQEGKPLVDKDFKK